MGSWAYISQKYIYFLFKRADHLNITCLSLFTHPHAVSNMPYFYSGSKNWQNVSCYFSQHQFKNVYSMSIHVNVKTPPSVLFYILESVFLMPWVIKLWCLLCFGVLFFEKPFHQGWNLDKFVCDQPSLIPYSFTILDYSYTSLTC